MYGNSSPRFADARRAPEVVEGDRGIPPLGEAKRELLVEAVETADVREDDDAHPGAVVGHGGEGREARPIGGLERDVLGEDGRPARERGDRRHGVEFEAHVWPDDSEPTRSSRRRAALPSL